MLHFQIANVKLFKQVVMRRPLITKTKVAIKFVLFWQKKTALFYFLIGVIVLMNSEKSQTCNRHTKTALWGFYFIVSLQFSPTSRVKSTANKYVDLPLQQVMLIVMWLDSCILIHWPVVMWLEFCILIHWAVVMWLESCILIRWVAFSKKVKVIFFKNFLMIL